MRSGSGKYFSRRWQFACGPEKFWESADLVAETRTISTPGQASNTESRHCVRRNTFGPLRALSRARLR
jgi:hypothetical protein